MLLAFLIHKTFHQLITYGQDEVKPFSTTYGEEPDPVVDAEQFAIEWEGFKRLIKNNYQKQCVRC